MKDNNVVSLLLNKMITIDDIMTEDIVYYESDTQALEICGKLNISYLPLKNGIHCFDRETGEVRNIDPEQTVPPYMRLFNDSLRNKFEEYEILFVKYYGRLMGVIHYSDYNRDAAMIYYYGLLLELERSLRALLIAHGFRNEDIIDYYLSTKERQEKFMTRHGKDKLEKATLMERFDTIHPFQNFLLSDLTWYINHLIKHGTIRFDKRINDDMLAFRNKVMHAKNPISKETNDTEDIPIYNLQDYLVTCDKVNEIQDIIERVQMNVAEKDHYRK